MLSIKNLFKLLCCMQYNLLNVEVSILQFNFINFLGYFRVNRFFISLGLFCDHYKRVCVWRICFGHFLFGRVRRQELVDFTFILAAHLAFLGKRSDPVWYELIHYIFNSKIKIYLELAHHFINSLDVWKNSLYWLTFFLFGDRLLSLFEKYLGVLYKFINQYFDLLQYWPVKFFL